MIKNVLESLEISTSKYKNKIIFGEADKNITYNEFTNSAKAIGTGIYKIIKITKKPVVIFIDKTIKCLEIMMGVLYSGNFYTIIDTKSPK